ncbi:splicing factor 3B subunit 4 [Histomonas meleagridis]|uniref:splicing factor 3B subunit 4 n=1 Tax=Histomonas meleagridis TaxID=135588 RepID=UPI00355AAC97|nr:splicing factor 3B subunit 4 [Histomonas meleagridis]KAH0805438.1 splicing factor 3B subunit 4 [Histomonas meleagridis]
MATPNSALHENHDATIYVGNISEHVTNDILFELFNQVGPVHRVIIPRDHLTSRNQGYGFVEFRTADDARYASTIMEGVRLFGNPLTCGPSTQMVDEQLDVGAKLYVGNLAPEVNDLTLQHLFSPFGQLVTCRVVIDPSTGKSRGHGFVSYGTFEAADEARLKLNGQFVCNQPMTVIYAHKTESKSGESHGDKSERLVAQATIAANVEKTMNSHLLRMKK